MRSPLLPQTKVSENTEATTHQTVAPQRIEETADHTGATGLACLLRF